MAKCDNIEEFIISNISSEEYNNYNIAKLLKFLLHKDNDVKRICIVGTPYGLLLYLLYIGDYLNTLFIFYGNYPLIDAIRTLQAKGCICLYVSNNIIPSNEKEFYQVIVDYISDNLDSYPVEIYGQDTSPIIQKFINERFTLFEDGRISYISENDSKKTHGFNVSVYDSRIKQIIYTGLEIIPQKLKDHSILINLNNCWNSMSQIQKNNILDIFGFNISSLNELIKSGRDIVIFTRNYSKVGKCSEANHIQMYSEIISHYNINNIIIKPHPNDNVLYQKVFDNVVVLPTKMPAELIMLCGLSIRKVVSVDASSNIFGAFNEETSIELYPELLNKYNVIKTRE